MLSDLTKASYTNYLCISALDLHGPAINTQTYPFFTCSIKYLFQAKSRKYQGIFEVKSRVQTWQVWGIWSQQLEHKQVPQWGTGKVSVPCWHATPVANAPWKPLIIGEGQARYQGIQNIFSRPVYMHVNCIIQRLDDVKQRFNPPICNMYPYVQLWNIFTIRGDMSLINP